MSQLFLGIDKQAVQDIIIEIKERDEVCPTNALIFCLMVFSARSGRWNPAEQQSCWLEKWILESQAAEIGVLFRTGYMRRELYGLGVGECHGDSLQS